MRQFSLVRDEDVSGVSGTGKVAEGVVSSNGKAVLFWLTSYKSVAVYDSIEELEKIHGHEGKTRVVFDTPQNRKSVLSNRAFFVGGGLTHSSCSESIRELLGIIRDLEQELGVDTCPKCGR